MGIKNDSSIPPTRVLVAACPQQPGPAATTTRSDYEGRRPAACLRLQHPATGQPASFLFGNGTLQELSVSRSPHAAWFADQRVVSDGGLWMATPMDPLMLLLPELEQVRHATEAKPEGVFIDLATAFVESPLEAIAKMTADKGQLECICEKKVLGAHSYYRLEQRRVDAWLDLKVEAAKEGLKSSASISLSSLEGPELTSYAVGLVAEYLSAPWAERLCQRSEVDLSKPKAAVEQAAETGGKWADVAARDAAQAEQENRNANMESNKRPKLDLKEVAKQRAKDRAKSVKAEQKAAQVRRETRGMAPLASFFKKK